MGWRFHRYGEVEESQRLRCKLEADGSVRAKTNPLNQEVEQIMHGVNGAKAPRGAFPPRAKATGIPSYRKFYLNYSVPKKIYRPIDKKVGMRYNR